MTVHRVEVPPITRPGDQPRILARVFWRFAELNAQSRPGPALGARIAAAAFGALGDGLDELVERRDQGGGPR